MHGNSFDSCRDVKCGQTDTEAYRHGAVIGALSLRPDPKTRNKYKY